MIKKIFSIILLVSLTAWLTFILTPRPYVVHWHANFALYIDGVQKDFSSQAYMEETSRCNITEWVLPADRIHLHDNKWDLVHVHMAASTWGDLFANLHISLGPTLITDIYGDVYQSGSRKNLYYILDGELVDNPANIAVESENRLLIWYGTGTSSEVIGKFDTLVAKNAHEYNEKADPASCSSNTYGWFSPMITKIEEFFPHSH